MNAGNHKKKKKQLTKQRHIIKHYEIKRNCNNKS